LYSKLKSSDAPAITSYNVDDKEVPIIVYKYDSDNVKDIIENFNQVCEDNELDSRIILARGVNKCKELSGIKDVDFKYWKAEQHLPYLIIDATFAFDSGDMDSAFRKIRMVLAELRENNLDARREFVKTIEHDVDWNARIFGFLKQVPAFSLSFKEWSEQTCLLLKNYWTLDELPIFIPNQRQKGYKMKEMANVPVEQYHQSNDTESEYHRSIDTIHAVKGATLDAVLLFLSSNSSGQSISLKDFPTGTVEIMTEKQRMIYVACSRARQFLALAVPKSITDEGIRQALGGVDIEIRSISLQGELAFAD
jgi:hypothetical protein